MHLKNEFQIVHKLVPIFLFFERHRFVSVMTVVIQVRRRVDASFGAQFGNEAVRSIAQRFVQLIFDGKLLRFEQQRNKRSKRFPKETTVIITTMKFSLTTTTTTYQFRKT